MRKWQQIKIKHHFVWEYYLRAWALDNKVFWLTSRGNVAHDSPKGMCRENSFYKITLLDDLDIAYIRLWSSRSPELLQKQHAKQLDPFIQISRAIESARESGMNNTERTKAEDAMLNNFLENVYSRIEKGAKPCIDAFKNGDISITEDRQAMIGLYSYVGHQVTRTKAVKDRFFSRCDTTLPASEFTPEGIRLMQKNWWFLCYMFGENLGWSLFCSRDTDRIILVKNLSNIPFITSDIPVINVHPENRDTPKGEAPDYLDLLFPVSPTYILMITSSSKWDYLISGANEASVAELNSLIAARAHHSIYGNCESVIQANKVHVQCW